MSDREIAEDLIVTEETARTYTKRLLRTLEVNNRVQAVLKGMRCGMVQIAVNNSPQMGVELKTRLRYQWMATSDIAKR